LSETTIYLSLGTNLGDRHVQLSKGLAELQKAGIQLVKRSGIYETEPMDVFDQPWFLNMVVESTTTLEPLGLLDVCKQVEIECGRVPSTWHGPRHMDIDILLYAEREIASERLTIPHPQMRERRFVLIPLLEIAPELVDPVTQQPYAKILERLDEGKKVFSSQINES